MSDRKTETRLRLLAPQNRSTGYGLIAAAALIGGLAAHYGGPAIAVLAAAGAGGLALLGVLALQERSQLPTPSQSGDDSMPFGREARQLIAVLDHPAFAIDANSRVITYNSRARLIFQHIAEGQRLYQVSRSPGLLDAVERARGDGAAHMGEISERTPTERRFVATTAPLDAASGIMLIQLRDVSEQDRLAQLRSDFIANASHELRTPLASLKGFIETLQGPASGDEKVRHKFLGIMAAQAARMARILDDLLSLSRIEMHAHVPPVDKVDVNAIARAAVQGLELIASDAQITLTLTVAEQPALVRGDDDELEQVFQNLIENAIKYGRKDGKVDVTVRRLRTQAPAADRIAVSVADDGPGIAEEHLPRLTERFYRADTASSRERGGTGLGLAIVKHILNRHRGELEIASEVGKGSTFTVLLDALSP
jgi:two-component system phosphate regulon sensor histidine kinase PhoR